MYYCYIILQKKKTAEITTCMKILFTCKNVDKKNKENIDNTIL